MKTKYFFTSEMDEQIRRLYRNDVGIKSVAYQGPVRDLALKFGMPRWRISRRAVELGILPVQKKEPNWSEKEIKILERAAQYVLPVIQRKLKAAGFSRSQMGILLKRKRMGFLKNLNGQSCRSVATCFGIDDHTITRWIEKGLLKAEKRGTNRTARQGGDNWYIKDKWIQKFITDNVAIIDLRKVDKYWFVDLIKGGKMTKNPCIGCDLELEDKNNDTCRECDKRVAYVASLGGLSHSVPEESASLAEINGKEDVMEEIEHKKVKRKYNKKVKGDKKQKVALPPLVAVQLNLYPQIHKAVFEAAEKSFLPAEHIIITLIGEALAARREAG